MEWIANVIVPLVAGVVGAWFTILVSTTGWFGRLIAHRWLKSVDAKFDAQLRRLQGEIDRTVIVHRVHFEVEFSALRVIWKKAAKLRAVIFAMQHPGPDPTVQAAAIQAFEDATAELVNAIDQHSPSMRMRSMRSLMASAILQRARKPPMRRNMQARES